MGKDRLGSAEIGLIRALCCTVLFWVADTLSRPLAAPEPQMMDEAVKFLESHFADKITSDALVLRMGYGRTQLFSLFKRHTGLSPNEYLVRYRIRKAKELLSRPGATAAGVAQATGFSSVGYFRKVFTKYAGVTPACDRTPCATIRRPT